MNKSTFTFFILFLSHGGAVSNVSINHDFDIDNVSIDIKYNGAINNPLPPIHSYSLDQNKLKLSSSQLNLYVISAPLFIDSSPELTSTSLSNLFRINQNGFSLYFQTFSNAQNKQAIINRIKSEYGVNVSISQIITFKISQLRCTSTIYCNNKFIEIPGKSQLFGDEYPIEVKFIASKSIKVCLEQNQFNIQFIRCNYHQYLKERIYAEFVSASQLNGNDFVDLLFENLSEKLMTRQQLADLANTICSLFCQEFKPGQSILNMDDFINDNSIEFKDLNMDDSFESLSSYFKDKNMNAEEIRSIFESVFRVKICYKKWKRFIGINQEIVSKISDEIFSSLGIIESYNCVRDNEETWSESTKSLAEQLEELNACSRNDVEWKMDGSKILPKSLEIAKLTKASFQNGLTFKLFQRVVGDFVAALSFQSSDGNKINVGVKFRKIKMNFKLKKLLNY